MLVFVVCLIMLTRQNGCHPDRTTIVTDAKYNNGLMRKRSRSLYDSGNVHLNMRCVIQLYLFEEYPPPSICNHSLN